ncbi:MAG TPA: pseudouridine synthase [Acidimicrobiia bacterium]|nr:pseudouridine synthase [Acidimicrobiia bacterium]
MTEVRLQKAISAAGLMSRRAAEDLIRAGRVTIDGRVAVLGDRCDPETSIVAVDGARIPVAPGLVTYLVSKPLGVVSTTDDPQGRRTVVDLVPPQPRVWPVGRLDADSEGLILVSNDGDLTNHVTHPSNGVTKTYVAEVEGAPGRSALRALETGVELEDGTARAVSARRLDLSGDRSLVEIVMNEGRNREVRRMCAAVGHPVRRLARTAIGPISDRSLEPGTWRLLTPSEVASLYRYGRA